jgi:hypothetical protein
VAELSLDVCPTCVLIVDAEIEASIMAWFTEPAPLVIGFGYPQGTLLHYAPNAYQSGK